ncbi:hypothetical protein LV779_24980 [Streptomyces thinghirensis]|nr:hypothetical protein [Streptomyces thinghirensis]
MHEGEVTVYGTLDSIDYPTRRASCVTQYPSMLPPQVVARLHEVTERVMRRIGFDSATFSVEYFYDPGSQDISLLEINPRHSQSHAELFQYVDGVPNHHAMVALALGDDSAHAPPAGAVRDGGQGYYRWFTDGVVRRVPSPRTSPASRARYRAYGSRSCPSQASGFPTFPQQDSYSYELAHIFTGGDDEQDLAQEVRPVQSLPWASPSTSRPKEREVKERRPCVM